MSLYCSIVVQDLIQILELGFSGHCLENYTYLLPFWPRPVSIFGLSKITTVNDSSHMLRIPPFLAPIQVDAPRIEVLSRFSLLAKAKGFIVIRASHKSIAEDACQNRKLLVIQQVGINPTLLKATYLVATSACFCWTFRIYHFYSVYIFHHLLYFFNKTYILYKHI